MKNEYTSLKHSIGIVNNIFKSLVRNNYSVTLL